MVGWRDLKGFCVCVCGEKYEKSSFAEVWSGCNSCLQGCRLYFKHSEDPLYQKNTYIIKIIAKDFNKPQVYTTFRNIFSFAFELI